MLGAGLDTSREMTQEVKMKTILITGATSGIGLETTLILTQQGFEVLGIARSEPNCIRAKERILSETQMQNHFFMADLMQQGKLQVAGK